MYRFCLIMFIIFYLVHSSAIFCVHYTDVCWYDERKICWAKAKKIVRVFFRFEMIWYTYSFSISMCYNSCWSIKIGLDVPFYHRLKSEILDNHMWIESTFFSSTSVVGTRRWEFVCNVNTLKQTTELATQYFVFSPEAPPSPPPISTCALLFSEIYDFEKLLLFILMCHAETQRVSERKRVGCVNSTSGTFTVQMHTL